MPTAFPLRQSVDHTPSKSLRIDIADERSADALQAIGSDTARTILRALRDDPGTAKDVAEAADTSIQNAQYHLDQLSEAGLVSAVDTWYSSKGIEMTVYALATEQIVIRIGSSSDHKIPPERDLQ